MASALTVLFLGCWLAGQSGVSGRVYLWGTGGTYWTQWRTRPTPTHSGSTGPGTESGCTKSPSTLPETGGSDSTQRRTTLAPNHPSSTEPGRTDSTQLGTTPASTHPLRARPSTRTGGRESSSNQPWKQPHPGGPTNWVAFLSTVTTKPPLQGTGGSEPSAAPGLTRNIIAGVSAAATGLLLLLLLVAFVRYRTPARWRC
ncbi:mucin-5AC-like isoform X1 [Mauremys reevesii]|uniref:mucin-5AC-like isoform X1 n=1 Tax=Mauremys reevesii TaxID=260615 RepID=UPI00193F5006|nr:mucin-5AC-like isoform X1 [Mauremys reevesii]